MTVRGETIAIIGQAYRFPGGVDDASSLWRLLLERRHGFVAIPSNRFPARLRTIHRDVPGHSSIVEAGCLSDIDLFDAAYFGVSPRDARTMDPHQRLLLELSVEAMADAGLTSQRIAKLRTAVLAGGAGGYTHHVSRNLMDTSVATGNDGAILANRLSYALNLTGEAAMVTTACSTSLTALHFACQALHLGEAEVAIIAVANLMLDPVLHLSLERAQLLSPDMRCHVFDATADGYARAEGAGVFILRPTGDAISDGDRIHGVILATSANANGRTEGISLPDQAGRAALMRDACARAGIDPAAVGYLEAHGTGTAVGDPIECAAIGEVFGKSRPAGERLLVGSIKSNLGHMELAAGAAGLAKALLVLRHRAVPPQANLDCVNPRIDVDRLNIAISTELTSLPDTAPIVAVNSFGFGGSNAHAILSAAPVAPPSAHPPAFYVLPVTARSVPAVDQGIDRMADFLAAKTGAEFDDAIYTAACRRDQHRHRLVLVGRTREDVLQALDAARRGLEPLSERASWHRGTAVSSTGTVFVFTGNGPQWFAMGRGLLDESPAYADSFDTIDSLLHKRGGPCLRDELARDEADSRIGQTEVAQPLLFALQVALVAHMARLGVTPDAVIGHSVGEVAAAHVAGALDLPSAVKVIHERSRCQSTTAGRGSMAAIGLPQQDLCDWLASNRAADVAIAAINSPSSCTIAGATGELLRLQAEADSSMIYFRRLRLDYAFHSPAMDEIEVPLLDALAGLSPREERLPFMSTVTGDFLAGKSLDAIYWWRNIRAPVQFAAGIGALAKAGYGHFVEIGPHPALTPSVAETLASTGVTAQTHETLWRQRNEPAAIARCVGRGLAMGMAVDTRRHFPNGGRVVDLPPYAWQRERFWGSGLDPEAGEFHPLLGYAPRRGELRWECEVSLRSHPHLADHQFEGQAILPAAAFIQMMSQAAAWSLGTQTATLYDLMFQQTLEVPDEAPVLLVTCINGDHVAVSSRSASTPQAAWSVHATGRFSAATTITLNEPPDRTTVSERLSAADLAAVATQSGFTFGPAFCALVDLRKCSDWWVADLAPSALPTGQGGTLDDMAAANLIRLDAATQVTLAFAARDSTRSRAERYLPTRARRFEWTGDLATACLVGARRIRKEFQYADYQIVFWDRDGAAVAACDTYRSRTIMQGDRLPFRSSYRWALLYGNGHIPLAPPADSKPAAPALDSAAAVDALCGALARAALDEIDRRTPQRHGPAAALLDEASSRYLARLTVMADPAPEDELDAGHAVRAALRSAPAALPEIQLLVSVSEGVPDIILGLRDGEDVLHNEHASPLMTRAVERGALGAASRTRLVNVIATLAANWPADRALRILDLGTRRSSVIAALLPLLPAHRVDYTMADVDQAWLVAAQARFAGSTALMIAAADPRLADDLARLDGPFDVIIGNDSLQEGDDIAAALQALCALLPADGRILLDVGAPCRFADFVFGSWRTGVSGPVWNHPENWPDLLRGAGLDGSIAALGQRLMIQAVRREPTLLGREPIDTLAEPRRFAILTPWPDRFGLAAALTNIGHIATTLAYNPGRAEVDWAVAWGGMEKMPDEVVYFSPQEAGDVPPDLTHCLHLARLVQFLSSDEHADTVLPTLSIVAHRLFGIGTEAASASVSDAATWGFARTIGNELPRLRCRRIDLHDDDAGALARFLATRCHDDEDEVAVTQTALFAHRLDHFEPPEIAEGDYALTLAMPGALQNLIWCAAGDLEPGAGQVAIAVHATALNYKDVLLTLGALPAELLKRGPVGYALGFEASGDIVAVGPGIDGLRVGDRVVTMAPGSFTTRLLAEARFVVKIPSSLSYEDAASTPTIFATAWYALHDVAQMAPGEVVLIHGGGGGVGLAAIQVAQHLGARVIATAGAPAKRALLRCLGVADVLDSRTLDFAQEARRLTGGAGVDVALNSLAGDGMTATLSALRPFGRFLEIGKRDFVDNRAIGLGALIDNISYHAIDLEQMFSDRPARMRALLETVIGLIGEGTLRPVPRAVVPATCVKEAFRDLQTSRHFGKLMVTYSPVQRPPVRRAPNGRLQLGADETHLVTGGTRGLGFEVARFLVERGARSLVLVGRSGTLGEAEAAKVAQMRDAGTTVHVVGADLADVAAVDRVFAWLREADIPPLRGVFHAAVTYHDKTVLALGPEDLEPVYGVKLRGAWHLDRLTRNVPLRFFVLFSSVAATIGSEGQATYAAANHGLDVIVVRRRARGQKALSIAWSAISDSGILTRNRSLLATWSKLGTGGQLLSSATAMDALETALLDDVDRIGIGELPWQMIRRANEIRLTGRLSELLAATEGTQWTATESLETQTDWWLAPTVEARRRLFDEMINRALAQTVGTDSRRIDRSLSLAELGMDSLALMQLVRVLEVHTPVRLSDLRSMQTQSIERITSFLFERANETDRQTRSEAPVHLPSA